MIMGSDERAACATFAHRQRDQRRSAKRLYRLAAARPEKVRAFLATQTLAEIRNDPAKLRLQRIVGT